MPAKKRSEQRLIVLFLHLFSSLNSFYISYLHTIYQQKKGTTK